MGKPKQPTEVLDHGYGWNVFVPFEAGVTVRPLGDGELACESHGYASCHHVKAVQRRMTEEGN